jgi:hypothetical protein
MINTLHPQDTAAWAQLHFAGVSLGDVRRSRRALTIAEGMADNPGQSIPQFFSHPYAVKAAYSFFDRPEATPERLQAVHRELVLERLRAEPGVYLLVEDSSEISFSGLEKPIEGLGFISNAREGLQGFLLHSVLAMRWQRDTRNEGERRPPVEVLGLASQSYRVREHEPRGRGTESSTARKWRARESEEWLISGARMGDAPCGEEILWVRVADRGADIYEFLRDCQQREPTASWCARRRIGGSWTPRAARLAAGSSRRRGKPLRWAGSTSSCGAGAEGKLARPTLR